MRFRSKVRRVAGLALFGLVASALLSACGSNGANILQPAGPVAEGQKNLGIFVFVVATVVFIIVITALIYCVVRFRDRPGAAAPTQLHGNTRLEIIWTIVPSALLVLVLVLTVTTMFNLANPPANRQTITVTARGHQWWWEFDYRIGNGFVTADQMNIPVNTVVRVNLFSDNVIHSFWVPELAGKTDVIPGHDNSLWLEATKYDPSNATNNLYRGECAEFCGVQHAHMDFVVKVQTQSDFNAWVAQQQQPATQPAAGSAAAQGKQVFLSSGCTGCHQISGVTHTTVPLIGPNLTHFGGRLLIAGGVLDNNTTNLMAWIYDAQAVKPGVDMPSFNGSQSPTYPRLSQSELNELVAYLESLQ